MCSSQGFASGGGYATVADAAHAITATLRELPAPEPGTPQSDDLTALLGARDALDARIAAHLAVFDAAGEAAATPALTTRAWLRASLCVTDAEAGRETQFARRLHTDPVRPLPVIAAAVAEARLTVAQAQAVVRATRRAPAEIIPALEAAVLASGTHLAPDQLGQHLHQLVDTLVAQAAALPDPEEDPAADRRVSLSRGFDGWWTLEALLEPDAGAALRLVLDDLAVPTRTLDAEGTPVADPRTRHQRQHDALADLAGLYAQTALHHAHLGDGNGNGDGGITAVAVGPAHEADDVDGVIDGAAEPPPTAAKGPCRTWPRPSTTLHLLIDADRIAGLIPGLELGDAGMRPSRLREQPGVVARTLDGTAIPGPAAEHLSCDPSLTWTLTRRPEEPLPPPRPPTPPPGTGPGVLIGGIGLPAGADHDRPGTPPGISDRSDSGDPGGLWLPPLTPRPWAGTAARAPREPIVTGPLQERPLAGGLVLPTRYDLSDETLTAAILESLDTIAPALGGSGTVILDAGHTRRLGSPVQRVNGAIRDRGCTVHGCTVPAWLCELHHLIAWILGGTTDLDAMALLCRSHHRFLHRRGWHLTPLPGTGRFLLLPPGHGATAAA